MKHYRFWDGRVGKGGRGPSGVLVALLVAVTLWMGVKVSVAAPVVPEWHSTQGPPGGEVHRLCFHPVDGQTVYAGTRDAFYRSTDGGRSWQIMGTGLPVPADVMDVAVSRSAPEWVALSTRDDGIFLSRNLGQTWERLSPLPRAYIALSPRYRSDRTLFAWWHYSENRVFHTGVVKIVGHTSFTMTNLSATALAVTPVYDGDGPQVDVFVANGSGIQYTTDGGTHWSDPHPITETHVDPHWIAVSPSFGEDHTLFVATNAVPWSDPNGRTGLFKSVDGGQTWRLMSQNLPQGRGVARVFLPPNYHDGRAGEEDVWVVLSGTQARSPAELFHSTDGGVTWTKVEPVEGERRPVFIRQMAFSPRYPEDGTALLILDWGIYRSRDGGMTWAESSQGIGETTVSALVQGGDVLYARVWAPVSWITDRVYRSEDGGRTWVRTASRGLPPANLPSSIPRIMYPPDLAALPDGSALYAWGIEQGGVYRSVDGGETWVPVVEGMGTRVYTPTVSLLRIAPSSPYTLYAVSGSVIYRSTNRGDTWVSLDVRAPRGIESLAVGPTSEVYFFTFGGRLFRSQDGGDRWEELTSSLPSGSVPWQYLSRRFVVLDPRRPLRVYVGASMGALPPSPGYNRLYLSEDGGEHWRDLSAYLPTGSFALTDLYISPRRPERLWLFAEDNRYRQTSSDAVAHRLFVSDDGGMHWRRVYLDPRIRRSGIRTMLLTSPHQAFVATAGSGVWTWQSTQGYAFYLPYVGRGQ